MDFRSSIYFPGRKNTPQKLHDQMFMFSKNTEMRPKKLFDMRFLKDFMDFRKLNMYLIMFTLAKGTTLRANSTRRRIETTSSMLPAWMLASSPG